MARVVHVEFDDAASPSSNTFRISCRTPATEPRNAVTASTDTALPRIISAFVTTPSCRRRRRRRCLSHLVSSSGCRRLLLCVGHAHLIGVLRGLGEVPVDDVEG